MIENCTKCILPSSYPQIKFDSDGVCNYCTEYEARWKGWKEDKEKFLGICKAQLGENLDQACILGLSGGKDSSYLLHLLVTKYKFKNIYTFTYDNGFLSDGAKLNIKKLCEKLNVPNEIVRLPKEIEQKVYQASIEKKSAELCMFCMAPAVTALINHAKQKKANMILMGISPRTEPQFPIKMLNAFDYRFFKDVVEPKVCEKDVGKFFEFSKPSSALKMFLVNKINFLNLAEYIDWNPKEIISMLQTEYDWIDYGAGIPHFDCMLEPLIDHFMYKRLGYSKVVENISILVRRGLLSREDAILKYEVEEVKEPPTAFIKEFCKRIGVTEKDFEPYLKGESLDYSHFKSNAAIIQKMSPVLKILAKIGVIPESIFRKYSI